MNDKSMDQQLREFLDWQEKSRRDGKTVEGLHEKQDRMLVALRRVTRDRLEDKEKLERHGRAIKTLQHQVGLLTEVSPAVPRWNAPQEETTGSHTVKEISRAQQEIEERLDAEEERRVEEDTWWRRQRWLWFGIALAGLFSAMLTGCVGYISFKIQALEKSINEKPSGR